MAQPVVRDVRFFLAHTPGLVRHGSKPSREIAKEPALWDTLINVPECSQMVYPDGGEVWCSPTSTSMVRFVVPASTVTGSSKLIALTTFMREVNVNS